MNIDLITSGIIIVVVGGVILACLKWLPKKINSYNQNPSFIEYEILVKMYKAGRPALINAHMTRQRHLIIAGEEFVNEKDDLYRLKYVEAMERLSDQGYVDETGDDVYSLTSKGLERARAVK